MWPFSKIKFQSRVSNAKIFFIRLGPEKFIEANSSKRFRGQLFEYILQFRLFSE